MKRRAFVQGAIVFASACGRPAKKPEPPLLLEEATIATLRRHVDAQPHGARELVERYLERIATYDATGPSLKSVVEVNPEAQAIADRLDQHRGARGPLHGIPILLKDNIDTGDKMLTTAGSLALSGKPASTDAPIVARLRAAGAVILGKTNLSEWANIRDRHATSGWSARGGFTKNPYVLDRNPSGSSSGSAAAVSANLAAAAIGTETVGSIVSPSALCGVVGLKPTAGLAPHGGIVPISHTQDTPGPIARSVLDAAIVHSVITGDALPKREELRGLRVGVRRGMDWTGPVDAVFTASLETLRGLGAELVDGIEFPSDQALGDPLLELLLIELKSDLASYLATRDLGVRTLEDVVRFNASHRDELAWFGQDLLLEAAKLKTDDAHYREVLATCRRLARDEGLDAAFAKHRLDVLVAPTAGLAWVSRPKNGDDFTGSSARLAAAAGYPHVTVPTGFVNELPVGLSIVGPPRTDSRLLGIALAYEQATKARRAPKFIPTLDSGH